MASHPVVSAASGDGGHLRISCTDREDPAKALCLKLAGTRSAAAPLTGLCDSSRCPQATHHLVHRSVWQTTADNGVVLLASPRIPPAEKARLRAEHERSMRVLEEIDTAAGKAE